MPKKSIVLPKPSKTETEVDERLVPRCKGSNFEVYSLRVPLTLQGKDLVGIYIAGLPVDKQDKFKKQFEIISNTRLSKNPEKCKNLGDGIFELKIWGERIYCFQYGKHIILTNGAKKKTAGTNRKLENEISKAKELKKAYLKGE